MRALLLAAAASLGLGGCVVIAGADIADEDFAELEAAFDGGVDPELERVLAASVEPGGLRIRAASNGCTSEDSFDVDVHRVSRSDGGRYRVSLERETPDNCRALIAEGVELFFTRERLGVGAEATLIVANPVGS
jgi:hypothetical protein